MKKNIRLILINIGITLFFIMGLNILSNIILKILPYLNGEYKSSNPAKTKKVDLPNYSDNREQIKTHFQERQKLETDYEAFIGWSRKPFTGKTINIDNNGDRIHNNPQVNNNQAVNFFGGSTLWGHGVSDQQTIPAFYASISGMPTFNRAESAFTSRQSLSRMINLIAAEQPMKTIVFYDGVNDVVNHCRNELQPNEHARTKYIRDGVERKSVDTIALETFDFIFTRQTKSLILELLKEQKIHNRWNCDDDRQKAKAVAETLVNNWEIAHDMAQAKGINFVAILQPVSFIGKPKLDHLSYLDVDSYYVEMNQQYQIVYAMLQEIIKQRNHEWILDYTDLFSQDEYIYIDFCHVSENGNQIIAQQLYQDIQKLGSSGITVVATIYSVR